MSRGGRQGMAAGAAHRGRWPPPCMAAARLQGRQGLPAPLQLLAWVLLLLLHLPLLLLCLPRPAPRPRPRQLVVLALLPALAVVVSLQWWRRAVLLQRQWMVVTLPAAR